MALKIDKLIGKVIGVVILAVVASSLSTTLIDSVNVSFGPITSTIQVLLANLAIGCVILFAVYDIVKSSLPKGI